MDIGRPCKLVGSIEDATNMTVYFNDWQDTHAYNGVFQITGLKGLDAAEVRTSFEPRPQRDGGVVHPFYRAGKFFTVEGTIIADTVADRQAMQDRLQKVTQSMLRLDGRFLFQPAGSSAWREQAACRIAGEVEIDTIDSALKSFVIPLYSENAYARSETETVYTILPGHQASIPNAGNAPYWPVCEIYGVLGTFTFQNISSGLQLHWDGLGHRINSGDLAVVRMDLESITLNTAGGASELRYIDFGVSDFWSLTEGSSDSIAFDASSIGGLTKAKVYAHDGWV